MEKTLNTSILSWEFCMDFTNKTLAKKSKKWNKRRESKRMDIAFNHLCAMSKEKENKKWNL